MVMSDIHPFDVPPTHDRPHYYPYAGPGIAHINPGDFQNPFDYAQAQQVAHQQLVDSRRVLGDVASLQLVDGTPVVAEQAPVTPNATAAYLASEDYRDRFGTFFGQDQRQAGAISPNSDFWNLENFKSSLSEDELATFVAFKDRNPNFARKYMLAKEEDKLGFLQYYLGYASTYNAARMHNR